MKIHKEMFDRWKKHCILYCHENGYKPEDVKTGCAAWNVAHRLGLPKEAYHVDKDINDTHIQTASHGVNLKYRTASAMMPG